VIRGGYRVIRGGVLLISAAQCLGVFRGGYRVFRGGY